MENKIKINYGKIFSTLRVLLFYIVTLIILMFTSGMTKNIPEQYGNLLSILLAAILTFFLTVLFGKWEKMSYKDLGIKPEKLTIKRFFSGFLIGLIMAFTQVLIVLSFGHLKMGLIFDIGQTTIILHLLLYFFVAFREELVFRSYFLRTLDNNYKTTIALSVMVIIFVFEHILGGMSWKMSIIGSGLGGLLFGITALKTKGIALPMGLHTAWNFGQWSTGFKHQPGIWNALVDKGYEEQTENIGLLAFILIMAISITLISSKKFSSIN